MKTVIIDYGAGNLFSILNGLRAVGHEAEISEDPGTLESADALILPGVGAFADGMKGLRSRGLVEPLHRKVESGTPLLGICLGMQLLLTKSFEFGEHEGLNLVPGTVKKFPIRKDEAGAPAYKIPHIGWSALQPAGRDWDTTFLSGTAPGERFYFVHSFFVKPEKPEDVLAVTDFEGNEFCSVLQRGVIMASQFHPEKSASKGLHLLDRFVQIAKETI